MTTGNDPGGVVLSRLCKSYGRVRAGKTTTLDMALGLTRSDSGSVSMFGMAAAGSAVPGRTRVMIRLLLADDQELFRTALAALLALQPDFEIVASVGRGDEVAGAARTADERGWL